MFSQSIVRIIRPAPFQAKIFVKTPVSLLTRSLMSSAASQQKILVAVVGVGLVGSELINQLFSIPPQTSPFKLISLSSSSRTLFTGKANPIEPNASWKSLLASSKEPADMKVLTANLAQLVAEKERVALVDNTSSDDIAGMYPVWLKTGINVVTPNKKAFSGDAELFAKILSASQESGARFFNEATVGAGLPVIAPLKELVATGDKVCSIELDNLMVLTGFLPWQITKIEGVFSGTMSYIFNNYSTGSPDGPAFSSVVALAREKGYTVRMRLAHISFISNLEHLRNLTLQMTSMALMSPGNSPFCLG